MPVSYLKAQEILKATAAWKFNKNHQISVAPAAALNCYLAAPLKADRDYPPFDKATMDGYALWWHAGQKTTKRYQVVAEALPGMANDWALKEGEAARIFTGAALPEGSNLVVKHEDVTELASSIIVAPELIGENCNIAHRGSETKKEACILKGGDMLTPAKIGLAAGFGYKKLMVYKKPRVAVLAVGDELARLEAQINAYQMRDVNSSYLLSAVSSAGFSADYLGIAQDRQKQLQEFFASKIPRYDVFVTSGGAAGSNKDLTIKALLAIGAQELFYRVAIKPGRQVWLGRLGETVIFVLPGNPLATQLSFRIYLLPFLQLISGKTGDFLEWLDFKTAQQINNNYNLDLLQPFLLRNVGRRSLATPVNFESSGNFLVSAVSSGFFYLSARQKIVKKFSTLPGLLW